MQRRVLSIAESDIPVTLTSYKATVPTLALAIGAMRNEETPAFFIEHVVVTAIAQPVKHFVKAVMFLSAQKAGML